MSPIPILTRRSTHPYPFSIPARSSSASHLPLSSDQDDDDDLDLAQAKAHQKAKPRSRRRVSFDLNTILHHPPALQEDEDDIEQEELQDDLPPLRTSSLAFTAQPMASHSSPNLPSMLTFASFGDREAPSRVVSGPVARTRLVSSPPEPSNSKLGRRLGPKILRSPLPAKARVARRTVIAQRHAAALELMLCGATTSASCELESHQHPKAAEPNVAKPRLARRWSLLPRLSSSKSVAKQEPESRDNDTSDPPASDEANTSTDSSTADTQAVPQSRRFGFFQRASPASSTSKPSPAQLSAPSPTKSALTPKQIKTLKAALMDFDLANGIIGELRARSVNPVEILARTDSAAASQGIPEEPEMTAVQVEPTRVQPRYVLGPLLPPLETALAAVSVLPSRHERGRSGNGSRDDSALPDPVRTSISEALETVGPQGDATKSDAAQEDNVGQETRQQSGPSSATPRMTARLSLANILNRVRSRSVSPSSAAATASLGVDSQAELLAAAGAATAAVATAVAITAATSSGSEAAKEKASVVILEEPGSAEAKDADTVAPLLPFGMSTALDGIPDAFPKLQPPKIMGMSPISLALSPRQTIVSQVAASSGAFDALADFSAAAIGPDSAALTDPSHAGFPTDRLSFLVHWWGYEILLPPLAMSHLSTAQSISSAFLSFLQTMAISASLPEMLPFIKYISMWVELEFRAIHEQDARGGGKGVVLAATWVMPLALVPRSWDYPVCSPDGSSGPDAVPAPASASGRPLPSVPANTAGATGPALGVGVVPIPEEKDVMPPPPPLTKQPRRISLPPTSPNRQLRNRLDGPIVPPKEKRSPFVSSPTPALLPIPVRF